MKNNLEIGLIQTKGMLMAGKAPLRARLSYWFDNLMSRGLWAKIGFLALVTLVFILVMGVIAAIAYGDAEQALPWVWWKTVMTSLGKGTPGQNDGPPLFVALMLVAMIYGMFLSSIMIGFISGSIREKVNSLMKGTGAVVEQGHTLILGFNEGTYVLLQELIEANSNQSQTQTIVVLGEASKETMDDALVARFGKQGEHPKTRIISRTGSIYDLSVLKRCAIDTCRSIIINGSSDFETTKAIMACTHILNTEDVNDSAFSVAVIYEGSNVDGARIAGCDGQAGDRLELLPLQEVLAKIIVHTSRQPGLSSAYIELFNFAGNEFYIIDNDASFPRLYGRTITEINRLLKDGIAVGVFDKHAGVVLANPATVVFEQGQSLIVVEQDDDALRVLPEPAQLVEFPRRKLQQPQPLRSLIVGVHPILRDVLIEYGRYLPAGSHLTVLAEKQDAQELDARITSVLESRGITVELLERHALNRAVVFDVLDACNPNCVVVLNDHCAEDAAAEDEETIAMLLYLRDYRNQHELDFSITSEILLGTNMEIASVTSPDDFIIGRHIAALLMAQIAENREMRAFFESLLSNEGFEVYLKHAVNYVPEGQAVNLYSAIEAVATQGELFIGIQQHNKGQLGDLIINPPKYEPDGTLREYSFTHSDYFVVLSESM